MALILLRRFVSLFLLLVCDDLPSKPLIVGIGLINTYFIFSNTVFKLDYFILHKSTESKKKIVFSKQMTKDNSSSPVVALQLWQSSQPSSLGRCLCLLLYYFYNCSLPVYFCEEDDTEEHVMHNMYFFFFYTIYRKDM